MKEKVEIVRCENCKYKMEYTNGVVECVKIQNNGSSRVKGDWFCADGENADANSKRH